MIINFLKMSGAGNDFILVDNRKKIISASCYSYLAQKLCQQKLGIGADGIIFLEKGKKLSWRMRYFNADGSEAAMCGNGSRCFAVFLYFSGYKKKSFVFETGAGEIRASIKKIPRKLLSPEPAIVQVQLPSPHSLKLDFSLNIDGEKLNACFLNTGVPHTIIFTKNLPQIDVHNLGRKIRYHQQFAPAGTNVNFASIIDKHNIVLRTYERGVEAETLACGTGATATAIVAGIKGLVRPPVKAKTRGGEILEIDYKIEEGPMTNSSVVPVKNVFLTGEVKINFSGKAGI